MKKSACVLRRMLCRSFPRIPPYGGILESGRASGTPGQFLTKREEKTAKLKGRKSGKFDRSMDYRSRIRWTICYQQQRTLEATWTKREARQTDAYRVYQPDQRGDLRFQNQSNGLVCLSRRRKAFLGTQGSHGIVWRYPDSCDNGERPRSD